MKKRLLLPGLVLLAVAAAASPLAAALDFGPGGQTAGVSIYIDGLPAEFGSSSFIFSSSTYVPIRDFSMAMGAESVTWDDATATATVTAPGLTVEATAGNIYLVANGRYLFAPNGCVVANGRMMVPIRVIAKAFDASVTWDQQLFAVFVTKGSGAITPGSAFYDPEDLYWMSRIINAEARGESLIGKIAVGSVVMNRVASPLFPDTVYDVIFDRQYGIQFTPAYSGAIYGTPSEESVIAAKIVLDGGNTAKGSLYFANTTNCWAGKSRPLSTTIGNHYFFA